MPTCSSDPLAYCEVRSWRRPLRLCFTKLASFISLRPQWGPKSISPFTNLLLSPDVPDFLHRLALYILYPTTFSSRNLKIQDHLHLRRAISNVAELVPTPTWCLTIENGATICFPMKTQLPRHALPLIMAPHFLPYNVVESKVPKKRRKRIGILSDDHFHHYTGVSKVNFILWPLTWTRLSRGLVKTPYREGIASTQQEKSGAISFRWELSPLPSLGSVLDIFLESSCSSWFCLH